MKKLYHGSQENNDSSAGDSKFSKLNQRFIRGKTNPSLGQVKCVPENNCLVFL